MSYPLPLPSLPFLSLTLPLSLCMLSLSEVAKVASKREIPPYVHNLVFEICCSDDQGEDVEVPYIKYNFK